MRDLRGDRDRPRRAPGRPGVRASLAELLDRFGESTIETWSDDDWEAFTLQALWRVCCDGVRDLAAVHPAAAAAGPPPRPAARGDRGRRRPARPRPADPVLRRVPRPGVAHWPLPGPRRGVLPVASARCTASRAGPPDRWLRGLAAGAGPAGGRAGRPAGVDPRVARGCWASPRRSGTSYLSATLLALRGWAGMVRPGRGPRRPGGPPGPAGEPGRVPGGPAAARPASRWRTRPGRRSGSRARSARPAGRAAGPVDPHWPPSVEQRAFLVFQLARSSACSPDVLHRLGRPDWAPARRGDRGVHRARAAAGLPPGLRAAVLHADARRHRPARPAAGAGRAARRRGSRRSSASTSARSRSAATWRSWPRTSRRSARPGSSASRCTTGGRPTPTSCRSARSVIRPAALGGRGGGRRHAAEAHRRRARTRRALGMASHRFHVGSRSFAVGALLTAAVGVLASVPLVARTLFPRLTARIRRRFGRFVQTPPLTRLQLERTEPDARARGRPRRASPSTR